MQISGHNELSFLVSNSNPPQDGFFQGYCFVDNDLVFGAEGARLFRESTCRNVPPAQDGCYVTVKTSDNSYIFDVDFSGYALLYYYHDGQTWVVSSSFAQVVDYLRAKSLTIRPNYAHIAAANGRRMALGQLFSLETMVHGVHVVPRTHSLVVSESGVKLVRRLKPSQKFESYEEALACYLDTWISRFETLMTSTDADFSVSLSGGVDSRTNFALAYAAMRRLGTGAIPPVLRSSGGPANRADLHAARGVARHFGLDVNEGRRLEKIHLSAEESFQAYRDFSMGVYFPFYRPAQAPTPKNITVGGGGGGIHRKTYEMLYESSDPINFFKRNAKLLKRPEFEEEFIRDGNAFLLTTIEPGEEPLRVLLREGRVRYHSGRTPRTEVSFTPLYSGVAELTQFLAGSERLGSGQFNYDIMHSVDPEIAELPYDDPKKAPSTQIRQNLVSATIGSSANPGKVWASKATSKVSPTGDELSAYKSAFDKAVLNPFVKKIWGREYLQEAKSLMSTLEDGISIGNPSEGIPISVVLSTDLASPN
ncbi:hypothetical protein ACTXJY_10100 [Corynebacterium casei]|uniref:hypothetical protein n=1 Tax=Corynebacterium casei TaxID=160386 RepID=UPI003FD633CB